MTDLSNFIPSSQALLAVGNLNAKKQDRQLDRSRVYPVQVVSKDGCLPIKGFNNYGELGISSMAFPDQSYKLIFFATSTKLFYVNLSDKTITEFKIEGLKDIHELTLCKDDLWVANTGNDEAIRISLKSLTVVQRIVLKSKEKEKNQSSGNFVDRFHCNQVFIDCDNEPIGLVHHVSGKQFIKKVAEKILKTHGNGGIIYLKSPNRPLPLNLKAPHSIRKVKDRYWIFDSAARLIRIYSFDWKEVGSIPTRGWGRGAAVTMDSEYFFAGISSTRPRYMRPGSEAVPNLIEVFSCSDNSKKAEIEIPNVEQVSNLYIVPKKTVSELNSILQ